MDAASLAPVSVAGAAGAAQQGAGPQLEQLADAGLDVVEAVFRGDVGADDLGGLGLAFGIMFLAPRISPIVALGMFFAYALMMGLVIGVIVYAFT